MVSRLFRLFQKEVTGLHEAAYLLGIFAILSQILALVRDRLFAHNFGAGAQLDIYYAAFRIPDFIFIMVASVVSVSVLVPFILESLQISKEKTKELIDSIFSFFSILIVAVSAITFWLMPYLVPIVFPGFDSAAQADLLILSRIILWSPILLGVSNFLGSITQATRKFFVYATSPLLYNAGIIVGILVFYPKFGFAGLGWGVALGALLHLLIQVPTVVHEGLWPSFSLKLKWRIITRICRISIPRALTLGFSQLVILLFISIASALPEGSISVFSFSWNLQSVPLSIVGVSYSLAAFPALSKLFTEGKRELFLQQIISASRHIIFWSLPIIVLFIVLRAQIVRTVLGSGAFDWSDTRLTAAALAIFSVSVLAQSLSLLFVRGYYAEGKTKIPLLVNLGSSIFAVGLAYWFIGLFQSVPVFGFFLESLLRVTDLSGTIILVLPLAYSLAMILNVALLWYYYESDVKSFFRPLRETLFQSFSASIIMGFVTYLFLNVFSLVFDLETLLGIFLQGFCAGVLGILTATFVLKILKSPELSEVWRTLHHKILKAKAVAPEPSEL